MLSQNKFTITKGKTFIKAQSDDIFFFICLKTNSFFIKANDKIYNNSFDPNSLKISFPFLSHIENILIFS